MKLTCNIDKVERECQNDRHSDFPSFCHCQSAKLLDCENYFASFRNDDDRHCPLGNQKLQCQLNPKVYLTIAVNMLYILLPKKKKISPHCLKLYKKVNKKVYRELEKETLSQ